jgi:hypothetical protein
MKAIIFTSLSGAQSLQSQVDTAMGLPCCCCPDHGGIKHGTGIFDLTCADNTTLSYVLPIKHPVSNLWAYPVLPGNEYLITTGSLSVVELSSDWFPTGPI